MGITLTTTAQLTVAFAGQGASGVQVSTVLALFQLSVAV
jgi:hypothetical protein